MSGQKANARRESLLRRVLVSNTVLILVLAVLITGTYLLIARRAFTRQLEMRADALATFIAAEAAYPLLVGDESQLRRIADSAQQNEDVVSVAVADSEGRISLRISRDEASPGKHRDFVEVRRPVLAPSKDSVLEWETSASREQQLGSVEVRVSLEKQQALFAQTILAALFTGGAALAAILWVQFAQMKRLLQPLASLIEFTRHVGAGDLRQTPVLRRDEVGELALSFNEMVAKLSETTVSRDYVDSIVRSAGDALLVTDRELKIRTVNAAALNLLGRTEEELIGRPISEVVGSGEMMTALFAHTPQLRTHASEETIVKRGAEMIPVSLTGSVLRNAAGETQGVVCLAQDITERKRVQSALIAAKEAAEESSRAKSTFLANMSHELRTPLNAVINYSEMLQEEAREKRHEQTLRDLEQIRSAGRHLLTLINDVLDLSKIEAGRMEVHLQPVIVGDVLREVQSTCASMAQKNGTTLHVENQGCDTAVADPLKLKQILMNLVGNACKFTERGTVFVRVHPKVLDGREWVLWEVRDTGIGIAPGDLPKLFRSFTQVDPSSTRKRGGTGLGLAISQKLAELMGGRITVSSALGSGSTFTLSLPKESDETQPLDEGKRPVLVIDRNPRSLAPCLQAWSNAGFAAEFATTASEASRKARVLGPRVLVINIETAADLGGEPMREMLGPLEHDALVVFYGPEQAGEAAGRLLTFWRAAESGQHAKATAVISSLAPLRRRIAALLSGSFGTVAELELIPQTGLAGTVLAVLDDEALGDKGNEFHNKGWIAAPLILPARGVRGDFGASLAQRLVESGIESSRAIAALIASLNGDHKAGESADAGTAQSQGTNTR
jgi:PAS domain S-box-containing protein